MGLIMDNDITNTIITADNMEIKEIRHECRNCHMSTRIYLPIPKVSIAGDERLKVIIKQQANEIDRLHLELKKKKKRKALRQDPATKSYIKHFPLDLYDFKSQS
jgi:hypothetical protein